MGNEHSSTTKSQRHSKKQSRDNIEQSEEGTTNNDRKSIDHRKKRLSPTSDNRSSSHDSSKSSSFSKDEKQTNRFHNGFPKSAKQVEPTNQNHEKFDKPTIHETTTNNNNKQFERNSSKRSSIGSSPSGEGSFDQAERRSKFRDIRYQSVRGTSFEPKLKRNFNKSVPASNSSSSFEHQSNTSTNKQEGSIDEHFEKMKISKKGKRINTIKSMQHELWDPFEVGDRTSLNFSLYPCFSVSDKPGEMTCHSLTLNLLAVPDDKLEQRLQLYDFEIVLTETKFALSNKTASPSITSHKLVRGHTFYGMSQSVKVNGRSALIEGNFHNPEYGKMDFFQFELRLVPVQFRELDCPTNIDYNNNNNINDNNNNNNNSNSNNTMTVDELFGTVARLIKPKRRSFSSGDKRVRETWWGTFCMKVRGSYKSKEYIFQVYEKQAVNEINNTMPSSTETIVSKESCMM